MSTIVKFASAESEDQVINRGGYQEVTVFKGEDSGQLVFAPATITVDRVSTLSDNLEGILERLQVLEEEVRKEQEIKVVSAGNKKRGSRSIELYEPFEINEGEIVGIERRKPLYMRVKGIKLGESAWDREGRPIFVAEDSLLAKWEDVTRVSADEILEAWNNGKLI